MSSSTSLLMKCYFLLQISLFLAQTVSVVASSDKDVLLRFKGSVSDPEGMLSSWKADSSDHCSWFGVSCDSSSRVVSLNVSGHGSHRGNVRGTRNRFNCSDFAQFPFYGFGIRRRCRESSGILLGNLPSLIANFTRLRVLSLPFNGFAGKIPSEIWGMRRLEVLDLEGNLLSGSLPVQFSGLRNLRFLNLGFNIITGEIPSSLSTCLKMETLNLAGNQMNGTVSGFVGRFKGVYLSYNFFEGSLPNDLGDFCGGKLEHLDLSANYFTGEIPHGLGNCFQLVSLLLYGNMLEGTIPAEIGQLQKLEVLDVSRNSFSGSIPVELGKCSDLSVIVLSDAFNVHGDVNSTREELSPDSSLFAGDFNFFQGGIPVELTRLPKLRILWAPRAALEGDLPRDWGSCDNLEMVNLSQNFFSGDIPNGIGGCRKLHLLDLSLNRLTGGLIDQLKVPCMSVFDVSGNRLSGSIPKFYNKTCPPMLLHDPYDYDEYGPSSAYLSFFMNKAWTGTKKLFLGSDVSPGVFHNFGDNNFTGNMVSLPISHERLATGVSYAFFAGGNKLDGPLPKSVFDVCGGLNGLVVNVSYNRLSGQIPYEVGEVCRSLKILDLSVNKIGGSIPSSLGVLASLVSLNLSSNLFQGHIPSSFGGMKGLKRLSMGRNNLSGPIPRTLTQLLSLEILDLCSNSLSGEIPDGLVNLKNLTVLLLNNNKLSGKIPSGFANATTLSIFNVSFNDLSGSLPSSNGLTKCSSVLGNPNLRPCRVFSLTVPSTNPYGSMGDPQNSASFPGGSSDNGRDNKGFTHIEIASVASASAIVSVLVALIILFLYTRVWYPRSKIMSIMKKDVILFREIGGGLTYENIVRATHSFNASNLIGNGGFGATYKAEISPGLIVAIKKLSIGRCQGVQQFHAEIKTLGRLHHPHLVTLIGYHASETEMFLIYNYLPGGNLEKFIQERSMRPVDWRKLHKIALDIARALAYLHDQCVPRVLHRDVKPSNILLDDDYNAYLSDFGLARLLGTSETHASTGVAGTFGYVAPEYAMTCRVSDKADVYSYGVVLLELLSDKEALDPSFASYGEGFNIVQWGFMLLEQGQAKDFFTTELWDTGPHNNLVEVLHLAVMCTVPSLTTRPTMKQVVQRLKQLQPPPY